MNTIETRKPLNRGLLIEAALLALVLAGAAAWLWLPARVPQGQQPLTTLDAPAAPQFAAAFDDAPAGARLVLLLSPT
ncbi:MAG TPA: hypothetical protein VJX29_01755 [Candidatus Acidoferrales bacterium]|nr:hypothetical protein [Candidatus Acidoferrales bacterium]